MILRTTVVLLLIVVLSNKTLCQTRSAQIYIHVADKNPAPLSKLIHGGFLEFIWSTINGSSGMWSQEVLNRGFDRLQYGSESFPDAFSSFGTAGDARLQVGGFNQRGYGFLRLSKSQAENIFGVVQALTIDAEVAQSAHIYTRSVDSVIPVFVQLWDTTLDTKYFEKEILPDTGWNKTEFQIPPIKDSKGNFVYRLNLMITVKDSGAVDIDEISIMPSNNVMGLRKEYFDFYYMWKPGSLRYPGGCYADLDAADFWNAIGPMDQRTSPNIDWHHVPQRMDFGVEEFMRFCDTLDSEPILSINFGSGTVQDGLDWEEYMNGDTTTPYGKQRKENGHTEPYNVTYWEIGNEQYGSWEVGFDGAINYCNRSREFYNAFKLRDSSFYVMFNGNFWDGTWQDTLLTIMPDIAQIISVHLSYPYYGNLSKDDQFWAMINHRQVFETLWLAPMLHFQQRYSLKHRVDLPVTEWWSAQLVPPNAENERLTRTLKLGLNDALFVNMFIRNSDYITLASRTEYINSIFCRIDPRTKKRVFYAGPPFYAMVMHRNNMGQFRLKSMYTGHSVKGESFDSIPALNYVAMRSKDTVILAVVNQTLSDTISTKFYSDYPILSRMSRYEILNSPSVWDSNDVFNPEFVINKIHPWQSSDSFSFLPHSFTVVRLLVDTAQLNPDSVLDPMKEVNSSLFPNPSSEFVVISGFAPNSKSDLSVFSVSGKLVFSGDKLTDSEGEIHFETKSLAPGAYFATVTTGEVRKGFSFVVSR